MEAATLLAVAAATASPPRWCSRSSDLVADGARIEHEELERAEAELGRAGLAALAA